MVKRTFVVNFKTDKKCFQQYAVSLKGTDCQKSSFFKNLKSEDKTGNPSVASERMDGLSNGQKDNCSTLENEQKVF